MLTEHRKRLILDRLAQDGRIVARDLSRELALSEDTIRRDLRDLAGAGLLLRVHGGALPASPTTASLAVRRGLSVAGKQRLGAAGARLVQPGQTVIIDGGTTHLELVRALPPGLAATVITHSPQIAAALEGHGGIEVILIGGRLFRHSMVAVGAVTAEAFSRLRADLLFLGVTGVHPQEGLTTGDHEEAQIKRLMVERAADTVVLATAEKFGAVSSYQVAGPAEITLLLHEAAADAGAYGDLPVTLIPV